MVLAWLFVEMVIVDVYENGWGEEGWFYCGLLMYLATQGGGADVVVEARKYIEVGFSC